LSLENAVANDNGLYQNLQDALENYVTRYRCQHKPFLWFAKTDITSCFESMKQEKLLQVMKEQTLLCKEYNVFSLVAVNQTGNRFFTSVKMVASPSGN